MTEAEMKPEQQMLRLSENQANYVALAQRVHNQLMAEGNELVRQGNAKGQEATATLRTAVEGAFKEQNRPAPSANIQIVNDERGRPAVLVWTDPEKPAEEASEDASADETDEKPKAAAPTNGKAPEAAKRKLPIK